VAIGRVSCRRSSSDPQTVGVECGDEDGSEEVRYQSCELAMTDASRKYGNRGREMKNSGAIKQAREENTGHRSGSRRERSDHMRSRREARTRQMMCATAHVERSIAIVGKRCITVITKPMIFGKNPRRTVRYLQSEYLKIVQGNEQCAEDWSPGKSGSAGR
jgi:hypothetical protein